ncbi:hypothetical protein MED217_07041 [Leeuwenhoekiella blandensis MED217]|uniref:Uncharacterized protein n=1 Tax=Leeuwenhoekiella blandensis (strain CECT 7118 / CCUG 51940 / KCTC 22103 / MED217) TaxID=398720 RepID=A3XMS9_LEEBM|nr:hypothetical protein MED217_07041 [Leeuwenhoekiella blandensis MED217]
MKLLNKLPQAKPVCRQRQAHEALVENEFSISRHPDNYRDAVLNLLATPIKQTDFSPVTQIATV